MDELVDTLDQRRAGRPAWKGKTDAHYTFLWDSRSLPVVDYGMVRSGIEEHPYRKVQYLHLQPEGGYLPLRLYHNHSPSTNLTPHRPKLVLQPLWAHVTAKTSVAQPAGVFAGDFNCQPVEWTACFTNIVYSQASRRTVQMCVSRPDPRQGDCALAMNVPLFQEDSRWGRSFQNPSFSDAHDVVLVPLSLCDQAH